MMSSGVPEWALPLRKKNVCVPRHDDDISSSESLPSHVAYRKNFASRLRTTTFEEALKFEKKIYIQRSERSLEAHRLADDIIRSVGRARRARLPVSEVDVKSDKIDPVITRCDARPMLGAAKVAIAGSVTAAKDRAHIGKVMRKNQSMLLPACQPLHRMLGENTHRRTSRGALSPCLSQSPTPAPPNTATRENHVTDSSPPPMESKTSAFDPLSSCSSPAPVCSTATAPAAAADNVRKHEEDLISEVSSCDKMFGRDIIVAYENAVGRKRPPSSSLVQGEQCKLTCVLTARQAKQMSQAEKIKKILSAQRTRRLHRPVFLTREHVRKFRGRFVFDEEDALRNIHV